MSGTCKHVEVEIQRLNLARNYAPEGKDGGFRRERYNVERYVS